MKMLEPFDMTRDLTLEAKRKTRGNIDSFSLTVGRFIAVLESVVVRRVAVDVSTGVSLASHLLLYSF